MNWETMSFLWCVTGFCFCVLGTIYYAVRPRG
jgi:hypothetical protein